MDAKDGEDSDEVNKTMLNEQSKYKTDPKNQYLAGGFILSTVSMSIGTVLGFSAILLPQLEEENIMNAKSQEASWIASLINIGQIFGSVAIGVVAGMFGRKCSILLSCIVLITSWAMIGFSNGSYTLLVVGRLLQGFGIMSSISQIYMVEISDIKRRGHIAGCGPFSVSSGITLVYALGALLPWRWVCLVCATQPLATLIVLPFLPETPNWLVHNGKILEAEKALRWLRGPNHDIESEIRTLQANQSNESKKEPKSDQNITKTKIEEKPPKWLAQEEDDLLDSNELDHSGNENSETGNGIKSILIELSKPEAYKPFLLLMATFILQQSCGSFAVIFYAVNVFKDIGATGSPYVAAILTGMIRQIGTLAGAFLMSRFPRKTLMVSSALLMALSMLSLGLTVHFKEKLILQKNFTLNSISHNYSGENNLDRVKRNFDDLEIDLDLNLIDNKTEDFFDFDHFYEKLKLTNSSGDVLSALDAITNDLERENASDNKPNFYVQKTRAKVFKRDLQQQSNEDEENDDEILLQILSILPVVEIVAYMMAFGLGVGTVPWLLLGELCPVQVKGLTSGVVVCTAYLTIFAVVKAFPSLVLAIGAHGAYYIFAAICLVTSIFSYFCVPETRGKSISQLQSLYSKQEVGAKQVEKI